MLVAGIGTYMKILIIDDHVLIREALHRVLRELKADVTVDEAATSRQALDKSEAAQIMN